ncbi:hypothetical protein H101_01824 [Trichophyton interdigitale H6]|nr:hypothetical protein H101_01824 [Trichophyton interdigitale H6]
MANTVDEGMQVLGMGRTTVSNRVSYLYNLNGPRPASPWTRLLLAKLAPCLQPLCVCHAFDASADGYARGESINVLYLKRVSDTLRDGDPTRGVIRGVSLTANGKNNGITLPSAMAQELSIRKAYEHSGPIDYNAVGFVECHGTGTPIGDPIETTAIANVFEDSRDWHDPILIGSTKPQVGHDGAGSTLTSIIKVVLAMEKGIIPGTIGINKLNPNLDLRRGCLAVVTKNTPWPANKAKRASVNSTGYGGANGHVVLETIEEYLKGSNVRLDTQAQLCFLLPVSAHDEYSLSRSLENVSAVLHSGNYDIHRLLYTLAERRTRFPHRGVIPITISNHECAFGKPSTGKANLAVPTVAFVFTGQGVQWAGMGRGLLDSFPAVKRVFWRLNKALAQLKPAPEWKLQGKIYCLNPKKQAELETLYFLSMYCDSDRFSGLAPRMGSESRSNNWPLIDSVAWTEGARSGGSHSKLVTEDGYEIISAKHIRWRQFENQGIQEKLAKSTAREPYYRLHWKPDVDFLDSKKTNGLYHSNFKSPLGIKYLDEIYNIRIRLETVPVLYICKALELIGKENLLRIPHCGGFMGIITVFSFDLNFLLEKKPQLASRYDSHSSISH